MKTKIKSFAKKFSIIRKAWHLYQSFLFAIKHPFPPYRKRKRTGVFVQLLSTFSTNDAIGNAAIEISKTLTNKGITNYIVYEGSHSDIPNGVSVRYFRFNKNDYVMYHMAIGCNASNIFKKIIVKKKIMYYHNITPAKYFNDLPYDQKATVLGRNQLSELKDCVDLAIGVSKYNEKELLDLGYKNTCVVPISHRVDELLKFKVNKINDGVIKFITVGRVARHKCIEDVIKTFYEFNKSYNNSCLYIIGSCTNVKYKKSLDDLVSSLNLNKQVVFAGPVTETKLAFYYSNADAYLCMSEHEGFCVPLIEAMAFGVPIFAYNSSAVGETIDDAGMIFDNKNYYSISAKIYEIINDKIKRASLCQKELNRYLFFDNQENLRKLSNILKPLCPEFNWWRVVQMIQVLYQKDAIGNHVLEFSSKLDSENIKNYIVTECESRIKNNVFKNDKFSFDANDIVIYHLAGGTSTAEIFKQIKCHKKIIIYHNITPSKYFYDLPDAGRCCDLGRKQLSELKDYVDLAIAVSKYNEKELLDLGYKNTCVIPISHRVNNLLQYKTTKNESSPLTLLTVGRLARNKKIEDVIKCFNEIHLLKHSSILNIVGRAENKDYYSELKKLIENLHLSDSVIFYSNIDEKELGGLYSNADAYLCMSEHEGFCVPLIEAMAFGVPIFAYDSSAISETIADAGIIFKEKSYNLIANTIVDFLSKQEQIKLMKEREKKRFLDFDNEKSLDLLLNAIISISK